MIPPVEDAAAEDPTTQMAWPSSQRANGAGNSPDNDDGAGPVIDSGSPPRISRKVVKPPLSVWGIISLSSGMLGAQIAWSIELGYGTPFLLGLGLSEQLTSLVWLAGPISGLIAQPVIGAVSDSSPSKYRRRYWIALSTAALVFSTLLLAYCEDFAAFIVDLFRVGAGDWDDVRKARVKNTAIGFAVFAFYVLDFALNALQASLRNLLLDIAPASQLNSGNAWHGRMTNAGNIVGYGIGFLPLAKFPLLDVLGGDQFRKFCVISIVLLVVTVAITCYCHEEEARTPLRRQENKFQEIFNNIYAAVVTLPKPIRRVCYVQLLAFMGWFPFLFYSTTYIGQIMAYEQGKEPDHDEAVRAGEFAMLLYSLVAVVAGTILPHLANRDRRLMAHHEDVNEDAEISRIRATIRRWKAEAASRGRPLKLPVVPFLLRNIWMAALLLFTALTFSTFFITTVFQATIFVSLVGICWAVAMWVPFAIIMELLKELQNPPQIPSKHTRTLSAPYIRRARPMDGERQPLLRSHSTHRPEAQPAAAPVAGGTVLGVHNLAIVAPQLIVSLVTSVIFRAVDGGTEATPGTGDAYYGKNGVAWVLRFGGLATLLGAFLVRMVAPTPTEKAMRRRRSEMQILKEDNSTAP